MLISQKRWRYISQEKKYMMIRLHGEASQRARHSCWVSDRSTLTLRDVNKKFLLILGSIKCTADVCKKGNVNRKTARRASQLINISRFLLQSRDGKVSLCYINARRKHAKEFSMKVLQFTSHTLHPCIAVAAVNQQMDQSVETKAPGALSQSKSSAKLKTCLVVWMMASSRLSCFYWSLSPNTNTKYCAEKVHE